MTTFAIQRSSSKISWLAQRCETNVRRALVDGRGYRDHLVLQKCHSTSIPIVELITICRRGKITKREFNDRIVAGQLVESW